MCMEEMELSPKQAKALLRSPCPLDDVYKEFRDREVEHMDTIRDSIQSRATREILFVRTAIPWDIMKSSATVSPNIKKMSRLQKCRRLDYI